MLSSSTKMASEEYTEIFYSKPSWKRCFLIERLTGGTWTPPTLEFIDASHIRAGFRVLRVRACDAPSRFAVTDGVIRDDNSGALFEIGDGGRYVLEHGGRRVGEADMDECKQVLDRPHDTHIAIRFKAADDWQGAYLLAAVDGGEWPKAPGLPMERKGDWFEIGLKAQRAVFAVSDGGERWHSNMGKNFRVGTPGLFLLEDASVKRVGVAPQDIAAENAREAMAAAPAKMNTVNIDALSAAKGVRAGGN